MLTEVGRALLGTQAVRTVATVPNFEWYPNRVPPPTAPSLQASLSTPGLTHLYPHSVAFLSMLGVPHFRAKT